MAKFAIYHVLLDAECWDNTDPLEEWVDGVLITDEFEQDWDFWGEAVAKAEGLDWDTHTLKPFNPESVVKAFRSLGYDVEIMYS